ncbi:hypothetical protein NFI96_008524 [Prochilodus magdalenae]|nr:hypothetical protein NFI96_008524 [Prochilodus magdalenae]
MRRQQEREQRRREQEEKRRLEEMERRRKEEEERRRAEEEKRRADREQNAQDLASESDPLQWDTAATLYWWRLGSGDAPPVSGQCLVREPLLAGGPGSTPRYRQRLECRGLVDRH